MRKFDPEAIPILIRALQKMGFRKLVAGYAEKYIETTMRKHRSLDNFLDLAWPAMRDDVEDRICDAVIIGELGDLLIDLVIDAPWRFVLKKMTSELINEGIINAEVLNGYDPHADPDTVE